MTGTWRKKNVRIDFGESQLRYSFVTWEVNEYHMYMRIIMHASETILEKKTPGKVEYFMLPQTQVMNKCETSSTREINLQKVN